MMPKWDAIQILNISRDSILICIITAHDSMPNSLIFNSSFLKFQGSGYSFTAKLNALQYDPIHFQWYIKFQWNQVYIIMKPCRRRGAVFQFIYVNRIKCKFLIRTILWAKKYLRYNALKCTALIDSFLNILIVTKNCIGIIIKHLSL